MRAYMLLSASTLPLVFSFAAPAIRGRNNVRAALMPSVKSILPARQSRRHTTIGFPADITRSLRGGDLTAAASSSATSADSFLVSLSNGDPNLLFQSSLYGLLAVAFGVKLGQRVLSAATKSRRSDATPTANATPTTVSSRLQKIQWQFLPVFWLFRLAFWMSGPYLYAAIASKSIFGRPASLEWISRIFLMQYGAVALFGPLFGPWVDRWGRKKGSLLAALLYGVGALSLKSSGLSLLLLGRALGGVGGAMMQNAPEAWLVSAVQEEADEEKKEAATDTSGWLKQILGQAYAMDALVAIMAGQVSNWAAGAWNSPTGPFVVSPLVLVLGASWATLRWKEHVAPKDAKDGSSTSLKKAWKCIREDPKIALVGTTEALFETVMYSFILQWPQLVNRGVQSAFGEAARAPFGTVFSCFMACCLLGSTLFGQLASWKVPIEKSLMGMLVVASLTFFGGVAAVSASSISLSGILAALFLFEACVGIYFPSIASQRGKYLPDAHRSSIMTLFGVPLNLLVVALYLNSARLGARRSMALSGVSLAIAAGCVAQLQRLTKKESSGDGDR